MEAGLNPERQGSKVTGLVCKLSRKKCSFKKIICIYFELFWYDEKLIDDDLTAERFTKCDEKNVRFKEYWIFSAAVDPPSAPAHKSSGVESGRQWRKLR